jgi:hypothetical protein
MVKLSSQNGDGNALLTREADCQGEAINHPSIIVRRAFDRMSNVSNVIGRMRVFRFSSNITSDAMGGGPEPHTFS